METVHQKGGTATKASLRQDGAKPGLSGIFHLHEDMVSPVLCLLPEAKVLKSATPSLRPYGYLGYHLGLSE